MSMVSERECCQQAPCNGFNLVEEGEGEGEGEDRTSVLIQSRLVCLEFLVFNCRSRYGPAGPVCHNELQEEK